MFHQVEGLAIDRDISMANLKWVLEEFCKPPSSRSTIGRKLRFRASHFPFTEPSAEVDYPLLLGRRPRSSWARATTGSKQVLGSGMVHPHGAALRRASIPTEWQGFAFGLGIDRLAMLKYGIPDLRAFFDSDLRWMRHYGFAPLDVPTLHGGLSR